MNATLEVDALSALAVLFLQAFAMENESALLAFIFFLLRNSQAALSTAIERPTALLALEADEYRLSLVAEAGAVVVVLANGALDEVIEVVPLIAFLANTQLFLDLPAVEVDALLVGLDYVVDLRQNALGG
jgi:hypothetical protein